MKLSENRHYLAYGRHVANNDYDAAIVELQNCINDFQGETDRAQRAFLLTIIGRCYYFKGQPEQAKKNYELAERTSPDSLQVKLFYAKFLAENLSEYDTAIEKCDSIIELAKRNPIPKTEDQMGSDYFLRNAEELKQYSMQKQRNV